MAELAAVAGLVASIATLVDLGAKIVARIQDFTAQTTDVPQSFRSLNERLPLLIRTLQQVQVRAQAGGVSDDVARDIETLVDSVSVQTNFIERCLRKITPSPDASHLEKTIKALQSLTKDERVTQAVERVHRSIDVLVLYQTTTSVDLSERILQEVTRLSLHKTSAQQSFGLCLDRAPQLEPDAFIGRTAELRQLDDWLSPRGDSPSQKVVSITGMGGLGKTQLSLAYARQHGGQYSSVFWLNAQDKLSLQQSILTLSRSIFPDQFADTGHSGDEERQAQRVRRWLSEPWNDRWLIMFDNYDDPALPNIRSSTGFDIREFFPSRAQGSILITTRSRKLLFGRRLLLQKLNDITLQVAILSQRAGRDLSHETDNQHLAVRLDGLPLALAIAGTYIGQTGCSCTDYLTVYDELWTELHGPESEVLLEYADRTLSSTWMISLDQVRRQDTDAAELLKFFALLNNEDIWYQLLRVGAPDGPAWMGRVTTTKIRFDQAMTKLQDYSLVEVISRSYRVHPCIHDWLLGQFQLATDKSWFLAAMRCVRGCLVDRTSLQYWEASRRLVPHIQRLDHKHFQHLWQVYSSEKICIHAGHDFGEIYGALDQFSQAEMMCLRSLAGKEKVLGPDHIWTLDTVNNLGIFYANQDKREEAEQMYIRALAGKQKTLGPDHISTLDTVNNLAVLYAHKGKQEEAEKMYIRVLELKEKALGADHTSTLDAANNLGNLYANQGKLIEAEQMYTRVLAGFKKALGPEHTSTLNAIDNLGNIYTKQGKLVEAEQMYTRVLVRKEKSPGPDHTSTLKTVNNLGNLYARQGKLVEAEQMYSRVLAREEKTLGPEHTSTLKTTNNLGTVYADQGKLVEAEQMYTRALAGFEKAFGQNHESTQRVLRNLDWLHSTLVAEAGQEGPD